MKLSHLVAATVLAFGTFVSAPIIAKPVNISIYNSFLNWNFRADETFSGGVPTGYHITDVNPGGYIYGNLGANSVVSLSTLGNPDFLVNLDFNPKDGAGFSVYTVGPNGPISFNIYRDSDPFYPGASVFLTRSDVDPLRIGFHAIPTKVSGSVNTTVPEPPTWAFMVAGFGMVGVMARRRNNFSITI